jgi:hypothetical protein
MPTHAKRTFCVEFKLAAALVAHPERPDIAPAAKTPPTKLRLEIFILLLIDFLF